MKQVLYTFFFFIAGIFTANATHERAGEIVYKHIEGLTYEVKIITYTYLPSPADRPELEIRWGDGTSSILPRTLKQDLTPLIRRNEYVGQHTYPSSGGGTFIISVEDPNRNYGIVNIPNSVNIPFYIETQLVINPFLGSNNSVQLLNPPLDYGCVNRLYVHNPGAYDVDGDSLSYKLTICKGANGLPIPGYTYPTASIEFSINELNGDLIWNRPEIQGEYNVAFIIEEWRNGIRIGYVTRDLQIQIGACDNEPPEILAIQDTCVEAGTFLQFDITATDPDDHSIVLSAYGSPFLQDPGPALMIPNPAIGDGEVTANFQWNTNCTHVQKNPHVIYIKAKDTLHNEISLSAYKNVNITVVAPAPEFTDVTPIGRTIDLQWDQTICNNAKGYYIYRKSSYYGFFPDNCETGVPAYTGYKLIAEINNINTTFYKDDNGGSGLVHGIEYCYMITSFFADGAESYASTEWCATLRKDLPVITNVSVEKTGTSDGEMYVAWSKPTELDTAEIPPPYVYKLWRKENTPEAQLIEVATYYNLNDTLFFDEQLNTELIQYAYQVELYRGTAPNLELVGSTVLAPSVYLSPTGSDKSIVLNWNNDVPWTNNSFVIYRQNETTNQFDSIGISVTPNYVDTGLINGQNYCYQIKTVGKYSASGFVEPIVNYSQIACAKPVDNIPPCAPELMVDVNCLELKNELSWSYPDTCTNEELIYYIYFSGIESTDFILYDSTIFTSYDFVTDPPSVVGCFTVTALDSLRNQSIYSNVVCVDIDECGRIWFPIVFTPNGDGYNEYFQADSVNSIYQLQLNIFNRWGLIVYKTSDPFFQWDGKDQDNNQDCSPGVYFYEGVVSEYTLRGPVERRVRGSVTLLRD
ncbi:MAG: gliding motility-associated C-terminal domain-containing protein [Bacteroidetes bacterium]|nr:gliding motility-associated C-terminal domain-containing protein [Bacteroidota bacterium]